MYLKEKTILANEIEKKFKDCYTQNVLISKSQKFDKVRKIQLLWSICFQNLKCYEAASFMNVVLCERLLSKS